MTLATTSRLGIIDDSRHRHQPSRFIDVPIISGDRVLGSIGIENYERENAFGDSEVRLLTTVAASMGVALENARLFDETQRLLKETEQRAAELAIINSIQEGLAVEARLPGDRRAGRATSCARSCRRRTSASAVRPATGTDPLTSTCTSTASRLQRLHRRPHLGKARLTG